MTIKRSKHELYEDNMAAADAMQREREELAALEAQQREEALAWAQHERDALLAELGIAPEATNG